MKHALAALAMSLTSTLALAAGPECPKMDIEGQWKDDNIGRYAITQKGCETVTVKKTDSRTGQVTETWEFNIGGEQAKALPKEILEANKPGGEVALEALKTVRYKLGAANEVNHADQEIPYTIAGHFGGNKFFNFRVFSRLQGKILVTGQSSWVNNVLTSKSFERIYVSIDDVRIVDVVGADVAGGQKYGFLQGANTMLKLLSGGIFRSNLWLERVK